MRIQYLGTAAAEGFPGVFCNCEYCRAARGDLKKELRTRSQVLIDGNLLVDFCPDTYLHSLRFGIDFSAVKYLLVTHSHTDHFYAQEFVNRGGNFAKQMQSSDLQIYANAEVLSVYREGTAREMLENIGSHIQLIQVRPFEKFSAGGYEILTLPASHTKNEDALLYSISNGESTLLYLNDTGLLREECYQFLSKNGIKAGFVSMDCTFADSPGPHSERHMGFEQNEIVRQKLQQYDLVCEDAKYYVTHFSHNSAPFLKRMETEALKRGFYAAHDGLTVEF